VFREGKNAFQQRGFPMWKSENKKKRIDLRTERGGLIQKGSSELIDEKLQSWQVADSLKIAWIMSWLFNRA